MPVNTFRRDRDFGHEVSARQRDPLCREAPAHDPADDPILLLDLLRVEKSAEFLRLGIAPDAGCQSHAKSFRARSLDAFPGAPPRAVPPVGVVPCRRRTVETDLPGQAVAR